MKNKKILMIISIVTLISFIIGFSYAYFTTIVIGNDTASSNITTSGSLRLTYNGTDSISLENSQPGDTDSMTFTVTNTGSLPVTAYTVNFSNVINTFTVKSELVYEIDCTSSDAVTCDGKAETEIPSESGVAITQTSIAPGTTHTYTLTLTFTDTLLPQDYNQNKSLMFKITINEQFTFSTLIAKEGWTDTRYFWGFSYDITSITFEDVIDVPVGAFASWDVSELQDGSIMAYIIDDGLGTSTYELYFQTNNDLILANPNSSYLFDNFNNLININNLAMLRTYYVTDMSYMFNDCNDLTSLDLNSFDTSNVINMEYMFYLCYNISNLDLSGFDTKKVTNMAYMFIGCSGLTSLDLSNFDTISVTRMESMFEECTNLTSLDLSSFNTSKVTNMSYLFYTCENITSLVLKNFDTSNVTDMRWMFYNCISLTSVDVNNFDTSNLILMQGMFMECSGLTSLDLSNFDTSNVTYMSGLFQDCTGLENININSFDTSNVIDMSFLFYGCLVLEVIDLSTFNTSKVTNLSYMFAGCTNLITINLSSFYTPLLTNVSYMFYGCTGLSNLDLRNATFTLATTNSNMFTNIISGITITVLDSTAQTFINARLTNAGKTGTVVIA